MLSPSWFGGVTGDIEFAREGMFVCKAGGAGSGGRGRCKPRANELFGRT